MIAAKSGSIQKSKIGLSRLIGYLFQLHRSKRMIELKFYTDGKRHLVCVPYSVENLHLMANQLGIKRCWYHAGRGHYDIPKKKLTEIENQCIMVSSKEIVRIING